METDRKRLDRAVESRMEIGSIFAGAYRSCGSGTMGSCPYWEAGAPPSASSFAPRNSKSRLPDGIIGTWRPEVLALTELIALQSVCGHCRPPSVAGAGPE